MKTKLIILSVMTFMSFALSAQTKNDSTNRISTNYKTHWSVKINFDLPALDPEAIQIAWLDFDPTVKFNSKFNTAYFGTQLRNAKDAKEKEMRIRIGCEVIWNLLFDVVKGSEMYLLTKQGNMLSVASDYSQPKIKKWLVSKEFMLDNKPYAYAVPIELENGSKLEITLNKSNLISLADLYEKLTK
jgi:hypothetical protein